MADTPEPRRVTSANEMRALAHPLRLRLLEELVLNDPATDSATATELAERVGESPANCSWHLRQLAKYGYIEEAPGGVGRERRWRPVIEARAWDSDSTDPEVVAASVEGDILIEHEYQQFRARRAWQGTEPSEWRRAAGSTMAIGWFTADELRELNDKVFELLNPYFERLADPAARPDGARLVRFVSWGIPARPYVPDIPPTAEEADDA